MALSLKDRLKASIRQSSKEVFLRKDFAHLGTYRQLSRALKQLHEEQVLIKAGYGLYARPACADPGRAARAVLARLGPRVQRHLTLGGVTVSLRRGERRDLQAQQDERKLALAQEVLTRVPLSEIRRRSLDNLERWEANGVWVSAFDEWKTLLLHGSDAQLRWALTSTDEHANRLRQSAPYTGMLPPTPERAG